MNYGMRRMMRCDIVYIKLVCLYPPKLVFPAPDLGAATGSWRVVGRTVLEHQQLLIGILTPTPKSDSVESRIKREMETDRDWHWVIGYS